jgi:hypothetical protein
MAAQQRHKLKRAEERIGNHRARWQRQRRAELAVHLGQEQGAFGHARRTVERGEAGQRGVVIGIGGSDGDGWGGERSHET